MRYINVGFTTTTEDYDLLQDANIQSALLENGIDMSIEQSVRANLIVTVGAKTQIKFNEQTNYNDFLGDKVYISGCASNFSKIIIKGNGIAGLISIMLG